jgi:hypothetical protein
MKVTSHGLVYHVRAEGAGNVGHEQRVVKKILLIGTAWVAMPEMDAVLNGATHTVEAVDQDIQVTPVFHFANQVSRALSSRRDVIASIDGNRQ